MEQDEFDDVLRALIEAFMHEQAYESISAIADTVMKNNHRYDSAMMCQLALAVFDPKLPVLDSSGQQVTVPGIRFQYLGPGNIEGRGLLESLYAGESVIRTDSMVAGSERRTRAWAALLLALYYYTEENPLEAAMWAERALGLDPQAAASWGAWYYLWHAYFGIGAAAVNALQSGSPVTNEICFALAALDWASEVGARIDPKCRDFPETAQNLRSLESGAGIRWSMCGGLRARARLHEDGFAGKFLLENALGYARHPKEMVACHQDITMDILTLRYKREYILQIENATETEIAEALSHCQKSWELAQELGLAGEFSQETLAQVKGQYDMVRQLVMDREQLRNMSHEERQELLDKQEQLSICRENGDLDRALQLANWCLSRANRNALTWWNKGQILMNMGDMEQAISCFRHAKAIDPQDSDYYNSLAAPLINSDNRTHVEEGLCLCLEGLKLNRADEILMRNKALAERKLREM